jgi:GNAT superfamily N-acetyltransferase
MAEVTIRRIGPADYHLLPPIETAADHLYADVSGYEGILACPVATAADYAALPESAHVFLAETDRPVGFAYTEPVGDWAYLGQLSVLPSAQGKGIGSALIARVEKTARDDGLGGLVLFTYADIPWNGPYYRRRGFQALELAELNPALQTRALKDQADWAHSGPRAIMGLVF